MKTIIIALVAMATTTTASASHNHNAGCKVNCPENVTAVAPSAKSFDQKMAELTLASENKMGQLNYNRVMQNALNQVETEKHQLAIANLEAETAYNQLMAVTLGIAEQEKLADQLEDMNAEQRFEQLMGATLLNIAAR